MEIFPGKHSPTRNPFGTIVTGQGRRDATDQELHIVQAFRFIHIPLGHSPQAMPVGCFSQLTKCHRFLLVIRNGDGVRIVMCYASYAMLLEDTVQAEDFNIVHNDCVLRIILRFPDNGIHKCHER